MHAEDARRPSTCTRKSIREEVRTLEEQMYWEDYWSRNDEDPPKHRKQAASMRQGQPRSTLCGPSEPEKEPVILTDDDVPF
jgi:hypothetical protein